MAGSVERAELVDRVRRWNKRLAGGEYELLGDLAVRTAMEQLSELVQSDESDVSERILPVRYQLGWLKWYGYLRSRRSRFDFYNDALELLLPCFLRGGFDGFPGSLSEALAKKAAPIAFEWLQGAEPAKPVADLWRRIVESEAGAPDEAWRWYCFAIALLRVHEAGGSDSAVDEAIESAERAVDTGFVYDVEQAAYLLVAGSAYGRRYRSHEQGRDRASALACYARVEDLQTAPAGARILAHVGRARLIMAEDPRAAARLLTQAVGLLPQLAPRHLQRGARLRELAGFTGLGREAAALTLQTYPGSTGDSALLAVQTLELGRAVLLSHDLTARTDLTELASHRPAMARRFVDLRDKLDQELELPEADAERRQRERRSWEAEFSRLLEEIRAVDGFHRFGLPLDEAQLLSLADQGPIVALTTSENRSDALLVTGDGATAVRLGDLTEQELDDRAKAFQRDLATLGGDDTTPRERKQAQERLVQALGWLWDEIAEPVLRALRDHHSRDVDLPRIWWMPCGPFALLPIHAAGYHALETDRAVVMRAVSSYTPTLRALRYARDQRARRADTTWSAARTLVVAAHDVPGLRRLNGVREEAIALMGILPNAELLEGRGPSITAATTANVRERLHSCEIAHFACHGSSDPQDPSQSRLILGSDDEDPFTVAALVPIRLGQATLVYLSACDTANTRSFELADEVVHLASAFQLAGFPHVIGTLWAVQDADAAWMAKEFYAELHETVDRAPYALHRGVRVLRDQYPNSPYIWAPFVHTGA